MGIKHEKQSGLPADENNDAQVEPSDWYADHTIDWAIATALSPVKGAAAAGSGTDVPRSDHAHQDSAAGRVYAYITFR